MGDVAGRVQEREGNRAPDEEHHHARRHQPSQSLRRGPGLGIPVMLPTDVPVAREMGAWTFPRSPRCAAASSDFPRSLGCSRPLEGSAGVHLVGGAVRDLLLGGAPVDLDLVVEGDAVPWPQRLGGPVRVHDRFGTCTVILDGLTYDLARARRERYPAPGALPEVEPAPLDEDLLRRDFTVNARPSRSAASGRES